MMTNREILQAVAKHLAHRFPEEWPTLSEETRIALTYDLVAVWEEQEWTTFGEATDILEDRLLAGNNPREGVLSRYGASIARTYAKKLARVAELKSDGFDESELFGESVRVKCSQCRPDVIQGVACHEARCPNDLAHR